jgi:hypothetical protein
VVIIIFCVQIIGVISAVLIFGSLAECRVQSSYNSNKFDYTAINCRKHSAILTDFGAVGDGKTLNTKAFNTAITKLSQYSNDGGALLIVPPGKWLTGSFNLTSHFTLFLQKDAIILASQVYNLVTLFSISFALNFFKFYNLVKGHFH